MLRQGSTATPRWMRLAACAAALTGGWLATAAPALAIEIHCIEASKYKYLYRLFNNDKRKVAAFLNVKPASLPHGDVCRSVVITGGMINAAQAKKAGQTADTIKLLRFIEESRGWLATLYLASSGGSVATGIGLANLTRIFWLKTIAVNDKVFSYYPDFGVVPIALPKAAPKRTKAPASGNASQTAQSKQPPEPVDDLAVGWKAYLKATSNQVEVPIKGPRPRCASACTFMHVAGIDRHGIMHVHRPRYSARKKGSKNRLDLDKSMTETLEGLQRSEATIIGVYRRMDAGEDVIRLFERTPTATIRPIYADRFPRYIADYLRDKCGADAVVLEQREVRIRIELAKKPDNIDKLRALLDDVRARRGRVETCIASAHEAERLKQFAKYCSGTACNRKAIVDGIRGKQRPKK
jgi:hypothetical protein